MRDSVSLLLTVVVVVLLLMLDMIEDNYCVFIIKLLCKRVVDDA